MVFTVSNKYAISLTIIISTTISPAKVVIMACSSRPDLVNTAFKTETKIPIAAILKLNLYPYTLLSPYVFFTLTICTSIFMFGTKIF